jgi:CBS-domain-containing membrane protein
MNTTLYATAHCRYRDDVLALAGLLDLTVVDANRERRHSIRCIPCAVVEDERGIVAVVEWDDHAPQASDLAPERLRALAEARDKRSKERAEREAAARPNPIDNAIAAVEAARDIETVKAAVVAALRELKGR